MSCNVAALPFQVHANYWTWSIGFDLNQPIAISVSFIQITKGNRVLLRLYVY